MDENNTLKQLKNNLGHQSVYNIFEQAEQSNPLQPYNPTLTKREAKNDARLSMAVALRCTAGVVLYALGFLLFAWGKLLEPSLLMMLLGLTTLLLGCGFFVLTEEKGSSKTSRVKSFSVKPRTEVKPVSSEKMPAPINPKQKTSDDKGFDLGIRL